MDSEDLATAAARLGLTVATVRKRLQRGTIKGFKGADGAWRVTLDKVDSRVDSPGQDHNAVVAILTDQVQFLRSQLQAQAQVHDDALRRRDEEIRRVHVLLQQEQQQVKALADQREREQRPWWLRLIGR